MEVGLLIVLLLVGLANAAVCVLLFLKQNHPTEPAETATTLEKLMERTEKGLRDELFRNRDESARSAQQLREELLRSINTLADTLLKRSNESRAESRQAATADREASVTALNNFAQLLLGRLTESVALQNTQLDSFADRLSKLSQSNNLQLESMRETVERKLSALQVDNNQKLEQMRATVDEKLHATLEQRLGDSFKIVSDRLELVHKGLGEMQSLATGVGDLKKVLTNIKTRGNWGEVQLGNLLEQMLTPDQYAAHVQVNPMSAERVDYAIKLPGRDSHVGDGAPVWLPIDSKFPQEDYQRLVDAADRGDAAAVLESAAALESRVRGEAKKIREKYVIAPLTTDFAILFLPTEGLFAEVLRRPGLCESCLRDYRVVLAGPTTLSAVLSSLQMGFRTLIIEKRSSEVWQVLGGIKTEFGKFGTALQKVQKKLQEASNTMDKAAVRSRAVEKKLREVQELPLEVIDSPTLFHAFEPPRIAKEEDPFADDSEAA
jgi:DNA recombination protein RmuC